MKSCGECTLCCKLERITELAKPRNEWCAFCKVGNGCAIYGEHPNSCKTFECWWLKNDSLGIEYRPDRIGMYAAGSERDGYLRVMVDPEWPAAWQSRDGAAFMDIISASGLHAIVNDGDQVTFVQGNATRPQRIMLDWIL